MESVLAHSPRSPYMRFSTSRIHDMDWCGSMRRVDCFKLDAFGKPSTVSRTRKRRNLCRQADSLRV